MPSNLRSIWTREHPKAEGYYWLYRDDSVELIEARFNQSGQLILLNHKSNYCTQETDLSDCSLFSGPIRIPMLPEK